jgi:hypothetical protein
MKQLFPKGIDNISYGNTDTAWSAISGAHSLSDTFGLNIARVPLPWACTVRNLVIRSVDPLRTQDLQIFVLKNGAGTALTGTLPAATLTPLIIPNIDVSYAQLDDICYFARTATGSGYPGFTASLCLEFDNAGNIFGLSPCGGAFNINTGVYGGALGNGVLGTAWTVGQTGLSNTYSICATDGSITTTVLKTFGTAPSPGVSWRSYYILNNILQDGSPGTVNTLCEITSGNTTGIATFNLPIVRGDHVDLVVYASGGNIPYSIIQVAAGVGFIPTNADHFMLVGGNNVPVNRPLDYRWNISNAAIETTPSVPIGPSKLVARGLYIERTHAPGVGENFVHTLRHNGAPTSIQVTINDLNQSGLIENQFELYESTDLLNLETLSSLGSNGTSRLFWGLEVTIEGAGPVPPVNGSIIVQKLMSNGSSPATEFTIAAGGGLTPSSFILKENESRIFENVVPGSGYSISETPPSGFTLVSITVSNGSPLNNIIVGEAETVIVTITNAFVAERGSGIYKIVPGKRNDTLWVDVDADTTRDVKKPNPFVKLPLVGE